MSLLQHEFRYRARTPVFDPSSVVKNVKSLNLHTRDFLQGIIDDGLHHDDAR